MLPLDHLPTRLPALLLAVGLLLTPAAGMGESSVASPGRSASAALDFRIIIPPVMQLLENSHPARLDPGIDGASNAHQRLVVVSNMKRGFCVSMRLEAPRIEAWRMRSTQASGITLQEIAEGYRLCTARPGRYTLLLQHEFEAAAGPSSEAMAWPVRTDITAL